MALIKTWYEPEAASAKFGVPTEQILTWVEDGLVRCEREDGEVVQVNIDDVKLELESFIRED